MEATGTRPVKGAQFDRLQFRARLFIVYALAAGVMLPMIGAHRYRVALFLALIVGPAHFVIRWLTGVPNPTGWLELLAVVSGTVAAALKPSVWPACLLFQMLTVAAAIAFLPPIWTFTLAGVSIVSMAVLAVLQPVPAQLQMTIVAAVFVPVLFSGSARRRTHEHRSKLRIGAAVRSLPMVVWEADATGARTLSIQGRTDELLGRSVDELRSRGLAADVHPDDREAYLARFGARRERAGTFDYRYVRPGGGIIWLRDQLVAAGSGQTAAVRGVSIDVTQDRRQDIAVQRYEQIAERMGSMTLVLEATDPEAGLVIVNAVDPIGWGLDDEVIGRRLKAVFPEVAGQPEIQALLNGEQRGVVRTGPWEVEGPSGGVRKLEVEGFPLPGRAIALLLDDVTEREQMLELVRWRAAHDELTGLANRTQLVTTATAVLDEGRRAALLIIDLNGFKEVNDTLGHPAGDHHLKTIAARLALVTDRQDVVARLGGDEFGILLIEPSAARLEAVTQAAVEACRAPVDLQGVSIASSAGIGIATAPEHAGTATHLLRCADIAMYAAKHNRVPCRRYETTLDLDTSRLELTGQLQAAFDENEMEMYFQPQIDAATGRLTNVEALVRWNHPALGLLLPETFLELVSLAGFTDDLLEAAVRQALSVLPSLPDDVGVAVNLTAHDVRSPTLADRCAALVAEQKVRPERLTFEITETHILDTSGTVTTVLERLHDLGVKLAIDDFGTGYSSMSTLSTLRLDELKIDKSFVGAVLDREADRAIVQGMVSLARGLDLTVTAEGVENEATATLLAEIGCDKLQGYFISKPTSRSDLLTFVACRVDGADPSRAPRQTRRAA
jgi:diguanylate cyclase (GGDEF)-like protein